MEVTSRDSGGPHLAGQGVQDVDGPAHVQALPQPPRGGRPRVQDKPLSIVPRSYDFHRIAGQFTRRRDLGQKLAVRAAEPKLAVGVSIELVTLLVNGAVVAATEHGEIRERGGAPLGPVTDVMSLSEPDPAAREPAAAVAVMERPPEGRRGRARSRRRLHHPAIATRPPQLPAS